MVLVCDRKVFFHINLGLNFNMDKKSTVCRC